MARKHLPIVFSSENIEKLTEEQLKALIMLLQAELLKRLVDEKSKAWWAAKHPKKDS